MKECLCNENYKALVINGNPSESVIQDKWLEIYSEFITLSHETDVLMVKSLRASIVVLQARLASVALCVNTLLTISQNWEKGKNDKRFIEVYEVCVNSLKRLRFNYNLVPTEKLFYDNLQMISSRSLEWEIHLELKQEELAAIEAKNTGEKVPPTYFTEILMKMSQYFKFMINERKLMTAEYCLLKKDFVNIVNKINVKSNARKR